LVTVADGRGGFGESVKFFLAAFKAAAHGSAGPMRRMILARGLPSIFSIMRPAATSGLSHPDVVSGGARFRAEVVDRALGFATADGMLAF
jgi:hypothetical protein